MKKSLTILALFFCVTAFISAQTKKQTDNSKSITADTTLANEYLKIGEKYGNESKYDSSNYYFEKAAQLFFQANKFDFYLEVKNNFADNLRQIGKYDSAKNCLNTCIQIGLKKLNDKHLQLAKSYQIFATICHIQGDYKNAYEYNNKSLQIRIEKLGQKHIEVGKIYHNLGIYYQDTGDQQKAIEYYERAIHIYHENKMNISLEVAKAYNGLANVNKNLGNYWESLDFYYKSLNINMTLSNSISPAIADNYQGIGNIFRNLGYSEKAIDAYNKSLKMRLKLFPHNSKPVASSYFSLANAYLTNLDNELAIEYYNKVLPIWIKNLGENHPYIGYCYYNIGIANQNMNLFNEAIFFYKKTLDLYLAANNVEGLAETYTQFAIIYKELNFNTKSLAYFDSSLYYASLAFSEKHPFVNYIYSNIGKLYNKIDPNKALEYHFLSLGSRLNAYGKKSKDVAESYQDIGNCYYLKNELDSACNYYQKSIVALIVNFNDSNFYQNPNIKNAIIDYGLLQSLFLKGHSLNSLYKQKHSLRDLQASLSTYELASELIDKIRHGYKAEGSKLFLGKKAAEIYENAIQAALTMYDVTKDNQYKEKAFFFAEKNRANVLLDAMADSRAKSFGDIPDSLLEIEKNLKIDLSYYDTQIQREQEKGKDQDSAKIAEYQDKSFDLNRQYQALNDTLEIRYPRYYELKYQTAVSSVSDIQKNLDDKTALIEYFTGDSNLYIFTITKNDFHVHSSAKDTSFNSLVSRFYISTRKTDRADYAATNYEIYKTLILPVAKRINKKEKWVVIPDGPLYYAPFEAMIVKPVKSDDYASLPYLVKERDIRYHYSATLWNRTSERKPAYEYEFAGFAPVFSDTAKNGVMIGTNFSVLDTMNPGVAYRSVDRGANTLRALPKSEVELSSIVRAFESRKKSAVGYLHRKASEDNFKARAASSRILHIATHGLINEKKPKLSALAFSQPEDSLAKDDGLLYAGEIYNLRSAAELVVLSSCESGLGEVVRGEGMMALTRGFIYAGSDHIVTSLWKVLDDNTYKLMTAMYAEMLSGRSYSESLRRAKLAMIKNPQTCAPSQWSAFVLFGK